MQVAIIGNGAIARYVQAELARHEIGVAAFIVRSGNEPSGAVSAVAELPKGIDLLVDCAGHSGLAAHGPAALRHGIDVLTLSLGALADEQLFGKLTQAAADGRSRLHLASGAIGALDGLRAAAVGNLSKVSYTGRKPPRGWKGSAAEDVCDLDRLQSAHVHFSGTARDAALRYPKNANVAAAVALASVGFDATEVTLIADPNVSANVHEIRAEGDFGTMAFTLEGNSLPDNPRSSALAAMSAVAGVLEMRKKVGF